MDGTDADEEWSDEDVDTTGALRVKSNNNQEDKNFQSYTITLKRPNNCNKQAEAVARMPTLTLDILTGDRSEHTQTSSNDPVSLVMDKIDAELEAMSDKDTGMPVGSRRTEKTQRKTPRTDTASQKCLTNMKHPAGGQQQPTEPDIPGDLDQLSPEQIDRKFQEILWKKKGIWSWRPSAAMLSTGYSTDNDSVRTEDFESKFMGMMVPPFEMETPVTKPINTADVPFQRTTPRPESKSPKFKPLPRPIINRPRSLSLNRKRSDKKTVSIHDADEKETKKELGRGGDTEERVGQAERRARSVSPTRSSGDTLAFRKSYHGELGQAGTNKNVDLELSAYRQTLHVTEKKVREAEEELRAARGMADNAKSELMVLEFNRGSASKELERITEEIARRKGQMSALDSEIHLKIEELKSMRTLGVTMEECLEAKTVKDENTSLKMKLRNIEGLQLERDELVRQLEVAKEDLFKEQKLGRERLGELQEVIETVTLRLEEAENLRTLDQDQIIKLEAAVKKMEREMNEAVQEKIQSYEERITYCNADKAECERRLQREVASLDEDVRGLKAKLNDLEMENQFKDSLVEKLRQEVGDLTSLLETERQDRKNTSSDQKRVLRQLKKDTAAAVSKLKESMLQEKQEALNELKKELEEERLEAGTRSDERLAQLLEEHSSLIVEKDSEIARLQDILRTIESDHQVREAVSRERERAELEKDWQLRHEKEEEKRRVSEVIAALEREKQTNRNLILEMTSLKKELEEQRKQQRDSSKDKLIAISRTKDQMKEQGIAEMERVKFNLKQEHEAEMDRLKDRLNSQEQELSRTRAELQEISERERLLVKALENSEQLVVKELNKACQRVADMIGGTKKVGHLVNHSESPNGRTGPAFKNRTAANTAVSSLHTCLEELEYYFNELQQGNEALRNVVKTIKKEKEEAIDNCRLEMERKRTSDLEKLKEQLLKEHVSEMSNVIRECAEANSQLKTNSQILQRYGDAALLEALQAKDDELRTLQTSLKKWQEDAEDRFNTQLQLQTAKEREKYQALQHHATREQKRINDLQKREIDRLENELQKLSSSTVHDSNRFVTSSPVQELPLGPEKHPSSSSGSMSASNSRSSQQYLQARIQQLQSENAALRKQRMLASGHLSWSTSNLAQAKPKRPMSPTGRSRSPTFDPDVILRLGERIKQGEREILRAEERAKQNRKVMNNKMDEMTKLQNKLFIQNQELQELERSYNDLQKHYHVSHGSSAQNLNTTF